MKKPTSIKAFLTLCLLTVYSLIGGGSARAQNAVFYEDFGDNGNKNTIVSSYSGWSATSNMFTTGTAADNYVGCTTDSHESKVSKSNANYSSKDYDGTSGKSGLWRTGASGETVTETLFSISNIDISGKENLTLSFGLYFDNGNIQDNNKLIVTYTIDDGTSREFSVTAPSDKATWILNSGNLEGTGQKLGITFSHYCTGGYTIRLDDIKVTSTTGGISVKPAAPTFSPAAGEVEAGTTVTLSSVTEGCTFYYTTNDEEPTTASTQGTEVVISEACTVKAIAVKDGEASAVATAAYTIKAVTPPPASGSVIYKRVESMDDIVDGGVYVVVCESASVAMGAISSNKASACAVTVTEDGIITSGVGGTDEAYAFTLRSVADAADTYFFDHETDGYLQGGGSNTNIKFDGDRSSTNANDQWKISIESGTLRITNAGQTNRGLFYSTAAQAFRHYAMSNYLGTDYPAVTLYRKVIPLAFAEPAEGWATYYGTAAYQLPAGVNAYAVGGAPKEGYVTPTLAYGAGDGVPAETPLLLKAAATGTAYLGVLDKTVAASAAYENAGNQLLGKAEATTVTAPEGESDADYYFYKLTTKDQAAIGFYWGAADGAPFALANPNRAYLALKKSEADAATSAVQGFRLGGGDATGIGSAAAGRPARAESVYTLSGLRLRTSADRLPAGVYIVGGRKVIVK